jgi:hypothetical protein
MGEKLWGRKDLTLLQLAIPANDLNWNVVKRGIAVDSVLFASSLSLSLTGKAHDPLRTQGMKEVII